MVQVPRILPRLVKLPRGAADPLPDVEIFHKAVDWALRYDEFHDVKQVGTARLLLARITRLAYFAGVPAWLVLRLLSN